MIFSLYKTLDSFKRKIAIWLCYRLYSLSLKICVWGRVWAMPFKNESMVVMCRMNSTDKKQLFNVFFAPLRITRWCIANNRPNVIFCTDKKILKVK